MELMRLKKLNNFVAKLKKKLQMLLQISRIKYNRFGAGSGTESKL